MSRVGETDNLCDVQYAGPHRCSGVHGARSSLVFGDRGKAIVRDGGS